MDIAFRVDESAMAGTGHLMRCLTLALELQKINARITFVCRFISSASILLLEKYKINFVPLKDDPDDGSNIDELYHAKWLGVSQETDAIAFIMSTQKKYFDWIVVDHYALDVRWESKIRPFTNRILVIDDLADRNHDCDILLDQNFYQDMHVRYKDRVSASCKLLLGPKYALLRAEFLDIRRSFDRKIGPIKRILVFFGGIDSKNYTKLVIEALIENPFADDDIHVDVVVGNKNPHLSEIESLCSKFGYICHVQTDHIAKLIASADFFIGAGGVSVWERCCLGLPGISICTAENQRKQLSDAASAGLIFTILKSNTSQLRDVLRRNLTCLAENVFLLKWISSAGMSSVDGMGVARVKAELQYLPSPFSIDDISIRLALAQDASTVWPWRNSTLVRQYSSTHRPIPLSEHTAWWSDSLYKPNRVLLVGCLKEIPFGVIRFDLDNENYSAEISIYIDPNRIGKGLGKMLLIVGLQWFKKHYPETKKLTALILKDNKVSINTFKSLGFLEKSKLYELVV